MIGPEPIIRIFFISVRLGIIRYSKLTVLNWGTYAQDYPGGQGNGIPFTPVPSSQ
jgi:hypothetical protein